MNDPGGVREHLADHAGGDAPDEHVPAAGTPDGEDDGSGRYLVRLDVFEGPFDLLLQLISRRKLDISEVDLADITAEFLAHLRPDPEGGLVGIDLDTATHFLVVAATLIELKAARLLPTEDRDELEDLLAEARDVLYARLLEYRAFRGVSDRVRGLLDANEAYAPREVALEPHLAALAPDAEVGVDAAGLAALAASALADKPTPHVSVAHIHAAALTVRDAARRVLSRLTDPGERATFRALVAGLARAERVVVFLALLELYKLGHVRLEQDVPFGPLSVERGEAGGDLSGLEEVDEPTAEAGGRG